MARGRFIAKQIITDREINELSSDACRLAFVYLLTLTDCEGRTVGEPDLVLAALFPRRHDITPEDIQSFIQEWFDAGMIYWYYADDGDRYIQFVNFEKHQMGLRKDREAASFIPTPEECRSVSGNPRVKLIKDKGKVNGSAPPKIPPIDINPSAASLRDEYFSTVGQLPPDKFKQFEIMAEKHITVEDLRSAIDFYRSKGFVIREPEQLEKSALYSQAQRLKKTPHKQQQLEWDMYAYMEREFGVKQDG
jgi:hypothetical protein